MVHVDRIRKEKSKFLVFVLSSTSIGCVMDCSECPMFQCYIINRNICYFWYFPTIYGGPFYAHMVHLLFHWPKIRNTVIFHLEMPIANLRRIEEKNHFAKILKFRNLILKILNKRYVMIVLNAVLWLFSILHCLLSCCVCVFVK